MEPLPILGQDKTEPPRGVAPLRLAFRPFYLLAASAAAASMPLWLAVYSGWLKPGSAMSQVLWHGHEMIFGVVAAVIVGFLFTAGKTWTGLATPRGGHLLTLALLWLSARIAALTGPPLVFFLLDISFLPLAAVLFAELLVQAGSSRNYGIALLLGLLGLINIGFHMACRGVIAADAVSWLHAGLAVVVMMESTIGGRVIPFFTRSVTPGLSNEVPLWRERSLVVVTATALLLWPSEQARLLAAVLLATAGVLHAWRLWTWQPWKSLNKPILWALHIAYVWIPLGMLLLAWSLVSGVSESPAVHAFTVGATGGLLIAMMTRTARGHTGRPLRASRAEVVAYLLVATAAVLRVVPAFFWPGVHRTALLWAGGCFSLAFCIYVVVFSPWLMAARADGKDG